MLATHPATTRRGLLLTGVGAAVTGCDLDPGAEAPATPAPTTGAPADPSADAELALLDEVRLAVRGVRARVSQAREHPTLRRRLAPLGDLHRAHLRALAGAGRATEAAVSPTPMSAESAEGALAELRRAEQGHHRFLAAASVRAASGAFARMLASMSAGVAAHLADLPDGP